MDNKQNDWVLLTLENPDFTLSLFEDSGINTNNTSIYDRDRYLNSQLIQSLDLFQTNGKFDQSKFNRYYDQAITSYNNLSSQTYALRAMQLAQFSYNNLAVSPEKRNKLIGWDIVQIANPDRRNYSTERIGFISDPKFTPEEIALNEKIWNNLTKQWEDSPNDSWLTRNWADPVVMATYDYDVDANGNITTDESKIVHRKGEYKINPETGTYYYEKLNGKTPYGKIVLSPFDIITRDGSKANEYDFFDSDSLTKSFTGSLMKNVARIAPMFVPYVGPVYVGMNIGLELAKVLPIVYKSTFGLAAGDNSIANTIEAFAMSMDNNKVSYEARDSFFNSENIFNLIGDVTKLLYELRWIFTKAPRAFKEFGITKNADNISELDVAIENRAGQYILQGMLPEVIAKYSGLGKDAQSIMAEAYAKASIWGSKYLQEYETLGRVMSRLYMSGTSSYLAFSDAKEEGASDLEAAAMFWGYFSGMYWLMGKEIGEHVLPELRLEKAQIKDMLKAVAKTTLEEAQERLERKLAGDAARQADANIFKKIFNKAAEYGKAAVRKATKPISEEGAVTKSFSSVFSNMLAEGVEEVSEEVLYDVTRSTFDVLAYLGGSNTRLSDWDSALERYGQSFIGGAIGGGLFQLSNDIQTRKKYDPGNVAANLELIFWIRNGKKAEIKSALTDLYNKQAFGDSNLSTQMVNVENGEVVYKEGTANDNQNKAVYDLMNQYVDFIDDVLSTENMHLPDDSIIEDAGISGREVLQEIRFRSLIANPFTSSMLQDYNSMASKFVNLHNDLDQLTREEDLAKKNDPQYQLKVDDVNRRLEELRKERENFFSLETQQRYLGLMMATSINGLMDPFANITFRSYAENNYHKPLEDLNEYEYTKAQEDYSKYLLYYAEKYVSMGYDVFMQLNEKFSKLLLDLGLNNYKDYVKARQAILNKAISVQQQDGSTKNVSLLELIYTYYGTRSTNDTDFELLAARLKQRYNPFDEISNFLIAEGKTPEGLSTDQKIDMLTTISENLALLLLDYNFIDSSTARTALQILKLSTQINNGIFESFDNELRLLLVNISPEDYALINTAFEELIRNLSPANFLEKINNLKTAIDNSNLSDGDKTNLLGYVSDIELSLNRNYTQEIIDLYNQINSQLVNVADSPITKFLADIKIGNFNVFEIISKSELIFKNKDLSEFVVDGEISIDDIKNARNIIKQLTSIVRATMYLNVGAQVPYGFNSAMNVIRKKLGQEELGVLDTTDASLMIHDLATIDAKLLFIERLHNLNQESSLKELDRVQTRLSYLSYELLGNIENSPFYNSTEPKKIQGEEIVDDKIRNVLNNITLLPQLILNKPLDISDNDRLQIQQEIHELENVVFDKIQELVNKYGIEEVLTVVLDGVIDPSKLDINSPGITSKTESFSDTDKLGYIFSVLGVRSSDFINKFNDTLAADTTNIAPIPMQLLSIRVGYIMHNNKELARAILNVLHLPEELILFNTAFISGAPGTGKTTAVARILHSMLERDNGNIKVFTVGPNLQQADNLANSLSPKNNTKLSKDELFTKLGTTSENADKLKATFENGRTVVKSQLVDDGFNFSEDDIPDIIYIDEATHFTNALLLVIHKYCVDHNITLILLGDPDQSGQRKFVQLPNPDPKTKGQQLFINVNNAFLTIFCITSPKNTVSMRDSNTNKRDNNLLTKNVATEFTVMEIANSGKSITEYYDDLYNKLGLKGTETQQGIYGELLVDSLTEEQVIKLIENLEDGEKLGYIYDDTNTETYQLISRLKLDTRYAGRIEIKSSIEMFTETSAQGSENQFFIVDINWGDGGKKIVTGDDEEDALMYVEFVKSLYTTTSRSKLGSYIINRGLTETISPESFKRVPIEAVLKVSVNDQSLNDYKTKLTNLFNILLNGFTPLSDPFLRDKNYRPVVRTLLHFNSEPTKTRISIDQVEATNFDVNTVDFNNNAVAIYVLPKAIRAGDTLQIVTDNGFLKITSNNPLVEVTTANDLLNEINALPNDKILFVVLLPKTTGQTISNILGGDLYINNHAITNAIINTSTPTPPTTPTTPPTSPATPTPPAGGTTSPTLPTTQNGNFKVGWVRKYNSKLYKITKINSNSYELEDTEGNKVTIDKTEFDLRSEDAKPKEFTAEKNSKTQALKKNGATKYKVGDEIKDQTTGKVYKVTNIYYKRVKTKNGYEVNVRLYELEPKKGKRIQKRAKDLDANPNFSLVGTTNPVTPTTTPPTAQPTTTTRTTTTTAGVALPVSTSQDDDLRIEGFTPLELANIINYGLNGNVGVKLYTAFGPRTGIAFEGDGVQFNEKNGEYTIIKAGDNGNEFEDLLVLLNISKGDYSANPKKIKVKTYLEALKALREIRSELMNHYNSNNPSATINNILSIINDFRRKNNIPPINKANFNFGGEFRIKIISLHSSEGYNHGVNFYPDVVNKEALQNKVLVFTIGLYEFTLGTIARETRTEQYKNRLKKALEVKVTTGEITALLKTQILAAWLLAKNDLTRIENTILLGGRIQYWGLPNYSPVANRITNTKFVNTNKEGNKAEGREDTVVFPFETYLNNNEIICSDPYIITDALELGFDIDMQGKAFTFVTHDLLLIDWPTQTSGKSKIKNKRNRVAELYKMAKRHLKNGFLGITDEYKSYLEHLLLTIKPVKLDVKGYTFKEVLESYCAFKNSLNNRNGGVISPLGNDNTGARLFEMLINMEVDILKCLRGEQSNVNVGRESVNGALNFGTKDEMLMFEKNLRNMLYRIIKVLRNENDYGRLMKLYNKAKGKEEKAKALHALSAFTNARDADIRNKFGIIINADYTTTIPSSDSITKLLKAFEELNPTLTSQLSKIEWLHGGDLEIIALAQTTKILTVITQFFCGKVTTSGDWKIKDEYSVFLDKMSDLVSSYTNPNAIGGATNNFTKGIFYNPTFTQNTSGTNRVAEESMYPANYEENTFFVSQSVQSPDYVVHISLAQTLPQTQQLPQPLSLPLQQPLTNDKIREILESFDRAIGSDEEENLKTIEMIKEQPHYTEEDVKNTIISMAKRFIRGRSRDNIEDVLVFNSNQTKIILVKDFIVNEFTKKYPGKTIVDSTITCKHSRGDQYYTGKFEANGEVYEYKTEGFGKITFTLQVNQLPELFDNKAEMRKTYNKLTDYLYTQESKPTYKALLDRINSMHTEEDVEKNIGEIVDIISTISMMDSELKKIIEDKLTKQQGCESYMTTMFINNILPY